MKKNILLATLILLITGSSLSAQDIIMKKNNDLIKCKIREIGLDEIKYNLPEYSADVLFSIDKDKIIKIILRTGRKWSLRKRCQMPKTTSTIKRMC